MTALLSGLEGNCLTSQRKLLAERDISERKALVTKKRGKMFKQRELLHTHTFEHKSSSLHALPHESIELKRLSNTNLWALHSSPHNSQICFLRALQHFILQSSFTCQPPNPWNSHETSLIKSNTFNCTLSKYPVLKDSKYIPSFIIRYKFLSP